MAENIFDNIIVKFEQFVSLVGNVLAHEKEIHIIQNKLRRHFNTTLSSYLCSTDFRSLLNHIHSLFNQNDKSTKYFTLLASFDEQLKKYSNKLLRSHQSSNKASGSIHNIESVKTTSSMDEKTANTSYTESSITISLKSSSSTTDKQNISASSIEQTIDESLDSCNNIFLVLNESQLPITDEVSKMITNSVNISEYEIKRKKKISKLERRLSSLSKTIRELEGKDLSLDEMRYSDLYLIESNLKKRAYEIYTKLAELKNQSSSVERILDQPVTLTETELDHPVITKALEDMINQTKFLPSFNDILDTVDKTNDEYQLNFSVDTRKNLAEKSFKIIGKKIKNRRMADFNDIMNSRLPEDFDIERNDPALDSVEIENTLLENERKAIIRTEQIFEEFSQIDPDLEPEINIESSEESTVESDEEEKDQEEEEEDDDHNDDNEAESESETIIEPFDNKPNETQYEIIDILPPFSPKSSTSSPSNVIKTTDSKDPVKATVEISCNDRTFRTIHTASIPIKRAARHPFVSTAQTTEPEVYAVLDDDDTQASQFISIIQEHTVRTIIPRRRRQQDISTNAVNETFCSIYEQRIISNDLSTVQKRSSKDIDCSDCKKRKEESEIVILD